MRTIVAGRIVTSEREYIEAALGFSEFVPSSTDYFDFAEFVEETTSGPANEIDAENAAHVRRAGLQRATAEMAARLSSVVPLPRRGTARLAAGTEVRAA